MNNRNRKKLAARRRTEYSRREGLHRLLDLVLDINGLEERKQSVTGNLPTAFFSFNGHTASADVRLYKQGWNAINDPDYSKYSWGYQDINSFINAFENVSAELRSDANESA